MVLFLIRCAILDACHTANRLKAIYLAALNRTVDAVTQAFIFAVQLVDQIVHFLALRIFCPRGRGRQ